MKRLLGILVFELTHAHNTMHIHAHAHARTHKHDVRIKITKINNSHYEGY